MLKTGNEGKEIQNGNFETFDLSPELSYPELTQFVVPGDVIDDVGVGSAVLRRLRNGFVALGGESAFKIEEFLLAVAGGG